MVRDQFELEHPPRNQLRGELPAILEPALRDMPEFTGFDVEQVELVEMERAELDDERLVAAARDAVLGDDRVRELMRDQRFAFIGVSRRGDDKDDDRIAAVAVAYLYDDARALEVRLAGDERELRVVDASLHDYQPPPSDEEIDRAIEIARGGRGISELLKADDEPMVLLVSDVDKGDLHHGTRRLFVGFGPADERLPRVSTIVDLGSETVVDAAVRDLRTGGYPKGGS